MLACIIIVITGISLILLRRITGPMRQLSEAAEKLGRGEAVELIPETGPREARATIRAFNQMQERLTRFMDDRTQMLAATSHDLRTPLTSLRLRAELVEDAELKSKMLATLDEMQKMVEAMLAFAREDSAHEDTRDVDLNSLIQSITDDLVDQGLAAKFEPSEKHVIRVRPFTLTRAIRNIIENATRHGGGAIIRIEQGETEILIIVDDNGPGIPETHIDDVFNPFMRVDDARNQENGGMGLGLGIARTIVRGHGGDITLSNRSEGGLRAVIRLPDASS
jgi:signal transduction histidine kinase